MSFPSGGSVGASTREIVEHSNAVLTELLRDARRSLRGESAFSADQLLRLEEPMAAMAAVMARSEELRAAEPNLVEPLELYTSQLVELQRILEGIHVLLVLQKRAMEAGDAQLSVLMEWIVTSPTVH
jgi:hypothetical protein